MSSPSKSNVVMGDNVPLEDNEMPPPVKPGHDSPPSNGDLSPGVSDDLNQGTNDDEPKTSSLSKEVLSPSRQKRESVSISGEQSPLEASPSKKPKHDASPEERKRDSTLLDCGVSENYPTGDSTSKENPISSGDSTASFPPNPNASPSPLPQVSRSPEKQISKKTAAADNPLLRGLLGSSTPPMSSMGEEATSLESPNPTVGPGVESMVVASPVEPPIDPLAPIQPLVLKDMLEKPALIPPPSPSVEKTSKILYNLLNQKKKSPSGTLGAIGSNIPPQPGGQASEPSGEDMQEDSSDYTSSDQLSSQQPSPSDSQEPGAKQSEGSEDVQVDEGKLSSQSLPSSSTITTSEPGSGIPSQPTSMNIPPESSEVPKTMAGRLKKMSDNLEGINLGDSSKVESQSRKSKRLQDSKKSSEGNTASSAPVPSAANPDEEVFKKPPVTPSRMKNRLEGVNLEAPSATDSPTRRSARIQSKDSRTASDGKSKESETSKSLSRERVAKLKAEGDALRSASLERAKTKDSKATQTRSREGTPASKKGDASSTSGSRERTPSNDSVSGRTRGSRMGSTSSNNSEADKTEEDEDEKARDKRKSRKDSSK